MMEKMHDGLITHNQHFNDVLLEDFANTFYGYGDYNAPYWFIGMEEGGGESFENVEARLLVWNERGWQELEDVAEFHRAIGLGEYFDKKPKRQPTWESLITMCLSVKGQDLQKQQLQDYQRDALGKTSSGENCLIELLPLPSPSTQEWMYGKHSSLPQLTSRKEYRKYYRGKRVEHIRERINQYRPRVVVFYSFTYMKHWKSIAEDTTFSFDEASKVHIARRDGTLFVVTHHPAAWGLDGEYFHGVGRVIAGESGKV